MIFPYTAAEGITSHKNSDHGWISSALLVIWHVAEHIILHSYS
jgi:hypothetical protein